jgi:1-acyl-sn-glycerol-3-phosphate acyltransferase
MGRDAAPDNASSPHRIGNPARRALGRFVLRIAGWTIAGDVPAEPKFVAILAPHTSNWDFFIGVAAMFALDLRVRWLGKHTLFRWPLGRLLRALGGQPVRRDAPQGVVAEVADAIRAEPRFILALAPEGTRRRVAEWRTGFYRIAERAGVPIVPVTLDWGHREIAIGEPEYPTGNATRDIDRLRARYRADMALRPEAFVPSRDAALPPKTPRTSDTEDTE